MILSTKLLIFELQVMSEHGEICWGSVMLQATPWINSSTLLLTKEQSKNLKLN